MAKILTSLNTFFIQCKRVWIAMKKPSKKEFEMISKVSAVGIIILGVLGFLISMVVAPFFRGA